MRTEDTQRVGERGRILECLVGQVWKNKMDITENEYLS